MSLLGDLADLGDTLLPSELPGDIVRTVAAVVKVLEHAGVTVDTELHRAPPEAPPAPEVAAAQIHESNAQKATTALEALLARVETAVHDLEGSTPGAAPAPTGSYPAPPAYVPAPAPQVTPASAFSGLSPQTPAPAAPDPDAPAGP